MFEKIIQLQGKLEGPVSIILAGVHGNERCGIEAMEKILPNLTIERGKVFFGYGNPRAIEKNVRFTEANLNRMFADDMVSEIDKKSYEYQRAQFLKKYLDQADVLLDLHASSVPKARAFAICESNAKDIVKYLPVNLVASGFDNIEVGGTDGYMNSIGKIGICLECGYLGGKESEKIAEEGLLAFLKARKHLSGNSKEEKQTHIHIFRMCKSKTNNFRLSKQFENFEKIEKDQLIGIDGQKEIRAPKESYILFAHDSSSIGNEIFLLGDASNHLQ